MPGFRSDITVGEALNIVEINEERLIRLHKTFGIFHGVKIETSRHGLCRATQGAPYPDDSRYRAYESVAAGYIDYSGDSNIQHFGKNVRAQQVAALMTFEDGLANVCNRQLLKDFATNYRWNDVVTSITSPRDFRPNTRVRLKYMPDIPDVTEDAPYTDLQTSDANNESL